jgi:2-oxoglutarate-Fe(II)-dependent oxygenase superfamily protein
MTVRFLDREALKRDFRAASPFPFVRIDNLLDPIFALEVAKVYPSFQNATQRGRTFKTVNEKKKVQITDARKFPEPVQRLNDALASPAFLSDLSYITGIPELLADEELEGGGMHVTGAGGRLDVHVDFNYLKERKLHRRINLLLYLNADWDEKWGGHVQLWDREVKLCRQAFTPVLNRCIVFETSDISFHGVTPVSVDAPLPRCSFAAYYYTREAPARWTGSVHSTIFKARPEERLRGYLLMPAETIHRRFTRGVRRVKQTIKRLLPRA